MGQTQNRRVSKSPLAIVCVLLVASVSHCSHGNTVTGPSQSSTISGRAVGLDSGPATIEAEEGPLMKVGETGPDGSFQVTGLRAGESTTLTVFGRCYKAQTRVLTLSPGDNPVGTFAMADDGFGCD